jgi:hypothetical protein
MEIIRYFKNLFQKQPYSSDMNTRMRIALCCAEYTINDEKHLEKFIDILDDTYFLQIDSILPINTLIWMEDKKTGSQVWFEVVAYHYYFETNLLRLHVNLEDTELDPQEFIDYLKRNWVCNPTEL